MGKMYVSIERKRLRISIALPPNSGPAYSPAVTAWKYSRSLLSDGVAYVSRSTCVRGSGRVEFSTYSVGGKRPRTLDCKVSQAVSRCDFCLVLANVYFSGNVVWDKHNKQVQTARLIKDSTSRNEKLANLQD